MTLESPRFYTVFFRDGTSFIGDTEQCVDMIRREACDNSHNGVQRMRQEARIAARLRARLARGRLLAPPQVQPKKAGG